MNQPLSPEKELLFDEVANICDAQEYIHGSIEFSGAVYEQFQQLEAEHLEKIKVCLGLGAF